MVEYIGNKGVWTWFGLVMVVCVFFTTGCGSPDLPANLEQPDPFSFKRRQEVSTTETPSSVSRLQPTEKPSLPATWDLAAQTAQPPTMAGDILPHTCYIRQQSQVWCASASDQRRWYRLHQADPYLVVTQIAVSSAGKRIVLLAERRDDGQEGILFYAAWPFEQFKTVRAFRDEQRPHVIFFVNETFHGLGEGWLFSETSDSDVSNIGVKSTSIELYSAKKINVVEGVRGTWFLARKPSSGQVWIADPASLRQWRHWPWPLEHADSIQIVDAATYKTAVAFVTVNQKMFSVQWQCRFTSPSSQPSQPSQPEGTWFSSVLEQRPLQLLWTQTAQGSLRLLALYSDRIETLSHSGQRSVLALPKDRILSAFLQMGHLSPDRFWTTTTTEQIWHVQIENQNVLSCPF